MTSWDEKLLRLMTDKEIRRCQDLVSQQIGMAHNQGNTDALLKLREWEDRYANEMYRRLMEGIAI